MKCLKCGAESPEGKNYCGDCGEQFSKSLPELVQAIISDKYKDQKLLDVETSLMVADRIQNWVKIAVFLVALPLAILVAILSLIGLKTWDDVRTSLKAAETSASAASQNAIRLDAGVQAGMKKLETSEELANKVKALEPRITEAALAAPKLNGIEVGLQHDLGAMRTRVKSEQDLVDRLNTQVLKTSESLTAQITSTVPSSATEPSKITAPSPVVSDPTTSPSGGEDSLFLKLRTNELALANAATTFYDEGKYESAIRFFKAAREAQTSGVWQSSYPFFAGSYALIGDETNFKNVLSELLQRAQTSSGYLSHVTTLGFLLDNLGKVRLKVNPVDAAQIDKVIDQIIAIRKNSIG